MMDLPWNEHAVASRTGLSGLREIVKEGTLQEVMKLISEDDLNVRGLRVSLPNRRQAPTSWIDTGVGQLVLSYRFAFPRPF